MKSPNGVGAAVSLVVAGPGVGGYVGIGVSPSADGLLDGDPPKDVDGGFVCIFGRGSAADGWPDGAVEETDVGEAVVAFSLGAEVGFELGTELGVEVGV